jgi:hypothetical protein
MNKSKLKSKVYMIKLDMGGNKIKEINYIILKKNLNMLWVNIKGKKMEV